MVEAWQTPRGADISTGAGSGVILDDVPAGFDSFLDGFMAYHSKQFKVSPGAISGETMKSLSVNSPSGFGLERWLETPRPVSAQSRHTDLPLRSISRASATSCGRASTPRTASKTDTSRRASAVSGASISRPNSRAGTASVGFSGRPGSPKTAVPGTSQSWTGSSQSTQRPRGSIFKRSGSIVETGQTHNEDDWLKHREACETMRQLVFGAVGYEHLPGDKDRLDFLAHLRRGSKAEIETFCELWCKLDKDHDGTVDVEEFISYFKKRPVDRIMGKRCLRYLMPILKAAGRESAIKEDFLSIMWLRASAEDIQEMLGVFNHHRLRLFAKKPPKLLSEKRRMELVEEFATLDEDNEGEVPFRVLVDKGIVDRSMLPYLRNKYDESGRGRFGSKEYLEMLAPVGCRAHREVTKLLDKGGDFKRLVTWKRGGRNIQCWLLLEDFKAMKGEYGFSDSEDD